MKQCHICESTENLEVRLEFGNVHDEEWYIDNEPIYFCDECWTLEKAGKSLFYSDYRRIVEKTIIIEPLKCLKCGTRLPIGMRELHGMPHTYYLPCPKCGGK